MKRLFSILLVGIFLTGYAGVAPALADPNKPKEIRIGCSGQGYGTPFSTYLIGIVLAKGLLEKEFEPDGIKITWTVFAGAGPAINEAFANDLLDVAAYGDFPAIIAHAGGVKNHLLSTSYKRVSSYIAVPIDSSAKSIRDLKGKKIAIAKGTASQLVFNNLIKSLGLKEKDFDLINLSGLDGDNALAGAQVDAFFSSQDLLKLRNQGLARIIWSAKDDGVPDDWKTFGQLVVIDKFAKQYPEIVQRIVNLYVKTAYWASLPENRDEVLRILAMGGTPQAFYKEDLEGRQIKDIIEPLLDPFSVQHYKNAVAFSKERNFIHRTFDVDEWVDTSYLNKALKAQGLENYWPQHDVDGKVISK
jgi:sulfonate transport system substrate-binding protein